MTDSLFPDDLDKLDPNKILAYMQDPSVAARWEGTVGEMVRVAEAELHKALGDDSKAKELARQVVFAICDHHGGTVMYMPRGT